MRIVVKVGTSTLAHPGGLLNIRHTEDLVRVWSDIQNAGHQLIVVSSAATGLGAGKLQIEKPSDLVTKQAAAAVGQCELMYTYDRLFGQYNHTVAQMLLTWEDFDHENRLHNLQNTLERLLQLHGVICKKDGTTVTVNIGEKPEDPVFGVSDLLIHLAGEQMEKKASKVIEGENLDLLVGSIPAASDDEKEKKEMKDRVKANILNILSKEYGVDEEDFLSAEIEVVPAGAARDYGFDRSMIMGYGHDDRVCAYPSFEAMLVSENPEITSVCLLVDKEEIGSVGASGMQSRFFENTVAEVMAAAGSYSELALRRALANSKVLSSDVSAAFDPNFPSVMTKRNTAYFGKGLVFNKYTGSRGKGGSNDANAEYIGKLRNIMDTNEVSFQTAELGKVDQGGGGTIAYILANYGMNVIDSGVPVLNMHAPWEIISKVDLYEALHGYVAFLKEA